MPEEFKELYENIAEKYSIEWEVLASIHREKQLLVVTIRHQALSNRSYSIYEMYLDRLGYAGCQGGLGNADVPKDEYTDPEKIKKYGGEGVDGNGNGKADPNEISDSLSATAENYIMMA